MGKQRREQPPDSIFGNNPFGDGFLEWMGSGEGQQCMEIHDVLWDLLEDVQLDAKQRQLIWPDAKRTARKQRLDLDQSVSECVHFVRTETPSKARTEEVTSFALSHQSRRYWGPCACSGLYGRSGFLPLSVVPQPHDLNARLGPARSVVAVTSPARIKSVNDASEKPCDIIIVSVQPAGLRLTKASARYWS